MIPQTPRGRKNTPGQLWIAVLFSLAALRIGSCQEMKPLTASNSAGFVFLKPRTQSTAVEDITDKPLWIDDLFETGSPFYFGLNVGETYDDNIFITPRGTADFVTHVNPTIDYEKGDRTSAHMNYFNLYLSTTFFFYEKDPDQNRQNYDLDAYYQHQWTRLTLGVQEQYQHLTDATIDIGNFVVRNINTTSLSGSYAYNDKLTLFSSASQIITSYPNRTSVDTNEWILDGYMLYQIAPKLALGVGPRLRYVDIEGQPNEVDEDMLAHLQFDSGEKITVAIAGGVERLQYQNNSSSRIFPIFDFTATYVPQDGTSLSLSASRQDTRSFDIMGESILNTTVQVSLRQQFLQDFYFEFSAGYTEADYEFSSERIPGPQRTDNYYFIHGGVEWQPKEWLKVTTGYQYSEDDSSSSQNCFKDNQFDVSSRLFF